MIFSSFLLVNQMMNVDDACKKFFQVYEKMLEKNFVNGVQNLVSFVMFDNFSFKQVKRRNSQNQQSKLYQQFCNQQFVCIQILF